MKFNRFMIYAMVLLAILTLGAANAANNATADDLSALSDGGDFDASLKNDGMDVVGDDFSDDSLSKDAGDDIQEISFGESESDNLALIPVTLDVNVVNNSRVDIDAGNITGNVIVIVDDSENTVTLDNTGKASFPLINLTSGNHGLVVIYEGDDVYDASHTASSFTIPEKVALISTEFGDIIIDENLTVAMVLKDADGNVIANVPVSYAIDGALTDAKTDGRGVLTILGKAGAVISAIYGGNERFAGTNTTLKLNNPQTPVVVKVQSHFNIPGGVETLNGYAVDTKAGEEGMYYSTQLLDANGKPVSGAKIQFAVNDKIYSRTTKDDGSFNPYKLNMVRAGRYTMAFFFPGNENYTSAFASACIDLDKKPIKIKASSKTFNANKKVKYTITLSTIVGSSHDGKAHLRSGKIAKLALNGKTYEAKTDKNGKVTFNIKSTKKGTLTATINVKEDDTYNEATKNVKLTFK